MYNLHALFLHEAANSTINQFHPRNTDCYTFCTHTYTPTAMRSQARLLTLRRSRCMRRQGTQYSFGLRLVYYLHSHSQRHPHCNLQCTSRQTSQPTTTGTRTLPYITNTPEPHRTQTRTHASTIKQPWQHKRISSSLGTPAL